MVCLLSLYKKTNFAKRYLNKFQELSTNLQEVSAAVKRESENTCSNGIHLLVLQIKATVKKQFNSADFHYLSAEAFSKFQLFPHFQPSNWLK